MRNLLGGKGANLAEMTEIGLPVPQGFTITTEACTQYYEDGRKINDEIMAQAMEGVAWMEKENGKKFGDLKNPLLVSVRSGARASMPGMMDTILNLGLNDDVVAAMIAGNPDPKFERFVYDSYRRFIQMFSDVVMEVGKKYFEQLIDKMKEEKGVKFDVDSRHLLSSSRQSTRSSSVLTSPPILLSSSSSLSRLYSVLGTTPVQMFTVVTTISLIPGVLQLT